MNLTGRQWYRMWADSLPKGHTSIYSFWGDLDQIHQAGWNTFADKLNAMMADEPRYVTAAEAQASVERERSACEVCGWPLAQSGDSGCVPGDCSYRPEFGSAEYHRIKRRREYLAKRDADRASASAESERAVCCICIHYINGDIFWIRPQRAVCSECAKLVVDLCKAPESGLTMFDHWMGDKRRKQSAINLEQLDRARHYVTCPYRHGKGDCTC